MRLSPQSPENREALLVQRCQSGDVQAFGELIAPYEKKVYNLAYRMSHDAEEAKDLAQEAFVKAYLALSGFRGEASFATWLFRIVTNVCTDALRKRRQHEVISLNRSVETSDGEVVRDLPDPQAGPGEALEHIERQEAVERAVRSLPAEYRIVVVLRDIHGYSYEQIASIAGVNIGTVKSRLNRARQRLKELLQDGELFDSGSVYKTREIRKGGAGV